MDAKARNCLLQHREALERDIKTSYIMDHMISDNVLTVVEEERVRSQVKPSEAFYMSLKFPVPSGLGPVSANLCCRCIHGCILTYLTFPRPLSTNEPLL